MIIGIGGVSRSGKTRLAKRLAKHFRQQGLSTITLHQDDFVYPEEEIPPVRDKVDWEHPESVDFERFRQSIKEHSSTHDVLIAEGLMALYDGPTNALYDKCFFVDISKVTFFERKSKDLRWGREPDWYMEHIWESFQLYGQPGPSLPEVLLLSGENPIDWERVLNFLNFQEIDKL